MENNKYLAKLYDYTMLKSRHSNNINDLLQNDVFFCELFALFNDSLNSDFFNLSFNSGKLKIEIKANRSISLVFDLHCVPLDAIDKLLFSNIDIINFILQNSSLINYVISDKQFKDNLNSSINSWDLFKNRIGYTNTRIYPTPDDETAKKNIINHNVVWYYNKSCSGKTFLGIRTLESFSGLNFVYNPSSNSTCNIEIMMLLLEFAENIGFLFDDLQCDTELAKQLFEYIVTNKDSLVSRNIRIFLISWLSLAQSNDFKNYTDSIVALQNNSRILITNLKAKLKNEELNKICDDNLALISVAISINKPEGRNTVDLEKELFNYFIRISDNKQFKLVYVLSVLASYEFEIPRHFLSRYGSGEMDINIIATAKEVNNNIFVAHRSIASFIASYIEKACDIDLPKRSEIITDYINFIDNKNKWKALLHLIGENKKTTVGELGFLWNLMYAFQDNLKKQTNIDPSWNDTPSSMYFVIATAEMLGVIDDYKEVVKSLCSKCKIIDGTINVKYDKLKTTDDFDYIKQRMIEEDSKTKPKNFEKGISIDNTLIHKNWFFGLLIGLREVLIDFGYEELVTAVEKELINEQCEEGYWYPKRVPWVTARILIGLSRAGYTYRDDIIKNGIEYLLSTIEEDRWVSHTGGWNNEYETSSLCIEALISCGFPNIYENDKIQKVISFLQSGKEYWMSETNEIDGATTACALFKIFGREEYLISYLKALTDRNIHKIIENELDYTKDQSCGTTQIAYYVIELCWYILEQDIPDLLDNFISRSNLDDINKTEGEKVVEKKIFISYSEDSQSHIKRVKKIADHLKKQGFIVFFYEDEKLGTSNFDFMQKINDSDIILIIGTRKYKEKVLNYKSGGVWFETGILAQTYMNNNFEKIIPIAFDEFNDSFASPFSLNKGIKVKNVTENFLKTLTNKLKEKF